MIFFRTYTPPTVTIEISTTLYKKAGWYPCGSSWHDRFPDWPPSAVRDLQCIFPQFSNGNSLLKTQLL